MGVARDIFCAATRCGIDTTLWPTAHAMDPHYHFARLVPPPLLSPTHTFAPLPLQQPASPPSPPSLSLLLAHPFPSLVRLQRPTRVPHTTHHIQMQPFASAKGWEAKRDCPSHLAADPGGSHCDLSSGCYAGSESKSAYTHARRQAGTKQPPSVAVWLAHSACPHPPPHLLLPALK